MAAKQRESRMIDLTSTELNQLPVDTNVYEGVGKMYVVRTAIELCACLPVLNCANYRKKVCHEPV